MKKKLIIWGVIIIVVFGLFVNKWVSSTNDASLVSVNASNDTRIPVKITVVMPESLTDKIVTTGTVLANEEVELHSEISARLIKIYFKEGSRLAKGDLMIKLNDADLQAQLLKADASKKLAESNEQRQRLLYDKQLLSQEIYDATVRDLNASRADIDLLRAQIDKTEIRAPFDGVIGLKYISEGSYITPLTKIATLQNIGAVKIDFSIPEKYSAKIEKDSPITFTIQGSDKVYHARVYAIEPKIDLATRTMQLRAIYSNTDGKVFPGAFANVELALKQTEALMVPTEALIPELKGQKVFLYKNGLVQSQSVKTGIRTDTKIQVTDGLNPNDSVIVTGILQIRPGMPVRITD